MKKALFVLCVFLASSSAFGWTREMNSRIWSMGYKTPYAPVAPVSSIDFTALTHVIQVGLTVKANGSVIDNTMYTTALISAAHASGVKVLIDINGLDANLNAAVTNNLAGLVTNVMGIVTANGYDGVDVDWEVDWDAAKASSLLATLRTALGTNILTITAIPGNYADYGRSIYSYVDRVNVMTYGIAGTWDPYSWFGSAIYGPTRGAVWSVELARTRFLTVGVPAQKLNIGIPFFGTKSTGPVGGPIIAPRTVYGSPPTLSEVDYPTLVSTYSSLMADATIDSMALVPWFALPDGSGWIDFEDINSVSQKVKYTVRKKLGGWIIWSLDKDYIASGVNQAAMHPLLNAVKNEK